MNTLEIILTALATLMGAGNVWQAFTLRSLRRVKTAEADQANLQTLNMVIESWEKNYNSLQGRYDSLASKYDALMQKYETQQNEMLEMRKEIAKLAAKTTPKKKKEK